MSEHRLGEVVIERPRTGWRISLQKHSGYKKQLYKLTQEASEDGLFRPYLIKPRHKTKSFSDHLGPLRRYLRSKEGQPWNQVYSELCQRLDPSTLAGQHVISHVWGYVERYVELVDGIPYRKPSWRQPRRLGSRYHDEYYIHPETGLLAVVKQIPRPAKTKPAAVEAVRLDLEHEYRLVDGIWYLVTFAKVPPAPQEYIFDVLEGTIRLSDRVRLSKTRYATHKRQCSKKELRAIRISTSS